MHIHLPLLKEVVSSYKYSSKVSIKLLGFNWVLYLIEGRKIFKYGTYSSLYGVYHVDINIENIAQIVCKFERNIGICTCGFNLYGQI